ncbi:hypothetical protein [Lutimonas zeaxanthinifaciens]|uniref:hypothetical protein n=1 Tax=Lutimonas zeaxanthinifaciens TaxID=3060215 RepID=UPI00265D4FD6|nr:hypothetical protein [Lutimonas sp. YSD2104]WKK66050.1 hypothetical protein QZH61_00145 [Lutimonas sp. YSD2104]
MKNIFFLLLILAIFSCKNESKQKVQSNPETIDSIVKTDKKNQIQSTYVRQSTDEQTANNLKNFLSLEYLKDEQEFLQPSDRKFQFYKTDLNDDGNEEIFVRFMGSYFCGSGGCTFLLLDKYGEIITKFTVTRAPIFVEPTKTNGWSLVLVRDGGVFKELAFKDGSYPGNPSLLEKAPYDAPSGHAQVMFDDDNFPCKTFEF